MGKVLPSVLWITIKRKTNDAMPILFFIVLIFILCFAGLIRPHTEPCVVIQNDFLHVDSVSLVLGHLVNAPIITAKRWWNDIKHYNWISFIFIFTMEKYPSRSLSAHSSLISLSTISMTMTMISDDAWLRYWLHKDSVELFFGFVVVVVIV